MPRILRFAAIAALALVLDQATKAAALAWLLPGAPLTLLPGFDLALGFNTGASFGMLAGIMAAAPLAMAAMTGAITLMLAGLGLRARNPLEGAGFALIVGGSLGNIADRLQQGAVTDFLALYWRGWHWPAFNLADVAITGGVVLILCAALPRFRPEAGRV